MTAIILLNWNGFRDTIACLGSLFACHRQDFTWMVVDNGSTDDSVREITSWLKRNDKDFLSLKEGEDPDKGLEPGSGVVYSLHENHGFAKGNNLGIALMEKLCEKNGREKPDHYLLLNNDTLVEPDFLMKLEDFAARNPRYAALTPQIRYADPDDRVWNCGGKMFFGLRKYLYGDKPFRSIREKGHIDMNLITGCALFAKRELLGHPDDWLRRKSEHYAKTPLSPTDSTDLLTNRFFFGEEDFDFSLRMQERKRKMACVLDSVIYHKLGSAREKLKKKAQTHIHYLNRFVDVRQHWGNPVKFMTWKILYAPYIMMIFMKSGNGFGVSFKETSEIIRRSGKLDAISKETFLSYFNQAKEK